MKKGYLKFLFFNESKKHARRKEKKARKQKTKNIKQKTTTTTIANNKQTFLSLFKDKVQIPQGSRINKGRQFIFNHLFDAFRVTTNKRTL